MNVFETIKPISPFLQKHIAYYYFHKATRQEQPIKFSYYPHFKNALTIYNNSDFYLNTPYDSVCLPNETAGYQVAYTKLIKHFSTAELHTPFDKVGVVFQPLGLNHFIDCPLSSVAQQPLNLTFNYFKGSIPPYLDRIYATDDFDKKVHLLDEYFHSIYIGFQDEILEQAIELLLKKDDKYTVNELSEALNVSRRTLLRIFRKHLNCSVKDYINVIQFRKALEIYQESPHKPSLTRVALDSDYYDQSEFIKHFTKLTGFNPKNFFKRVVKYGSEKTYWAFES